MKRPNPSITRYLRTAWMASPLLLAGLMALTLVSRAAPAGASTPLAGTQSARTAAGPPPVTVLANFPAIGLPSGPARISALVVHLPAGTNFTHVHGGNVYNYIISGSVTSVDNGVARTYRPGQFFWEPVGHVHTVITRKPASFFSLQILTPRAAPTIPSQ